LRLAYLRLLAATSLGWVLLVGSAAAEARGDTSLGDSAVVLGTGGSGVKVRSGPGLSYNILGVVSEGTRVNVLNGPQSDGDQNWYQIQSNDGAGGRVRGWAAAMYLVSSERVRLREDGTVGGRSFTAKVMSYTSGNGIGPYTSTGTRCHLGTVAVDPRYIPLGSLLTVEGLDGIFTAEDTGSAVKGASLDVWFPDMSSAQRWGTQQRAVTVLREGY
jgi:3D (Asp-Asp-Asp) domain-containing protein